MTHARLYLAPVSSAFDIRMAVLSLQAWRKKCEGSGAQAEQRSAAALQPPSRDAAASNGGGCCASAHVLASIAARGRLGLGACSRAGRQRRSTDGRWGSAHEARPWRGDRAPAAARQNGHCRWVTGGGCGVWKRGC